MSNINIIQIAKHIADDLPGVTRDEWMRWAANVRGHGDLPEAIALAEAVAQSGERPAVANRLIARTMRRALENGLLEDLDDQDLRNVLNVVGWLLATSLRLACRFCSTPLQDLYSRTPLEEFTTCPCCGAVVVFTTDPLGVRREIAEVILRRDVVAPEEAWRIETNIVPDIDALFDESGDEVGRVHLVVGWDPDEMLSTPQVARILGATPRRVAHAAEEGKFPGAVKVPPRRGRRGFWRIPRQDVMDYMRARRRGES